MPRPQTFAAFRTSSDAPHCVLVLDERAGAPSSCVLVRDASASPSTSPTFVARALAEQVGLDPGNMTLGADVAVGLDQ